MGVDMYIGDKQVRLTNAYFYNNFLNFVAQTGDFPQILEHSPIHGEYVLGQEPASMYRGSVEELKKELEKLESMSPPEFAADIIASMLEACEEAIENGTKISMDDGAWFGN